MSIYNYLYDWQKKIVDQFNDKKSLGIFLDCGLGKTPIGLAFAEQHECSKIIIITINSKAIEDENVNGSFFWWLKKSNIAYNLYNKKHTFDHSGPKKYQAEIDIHTNDVLMLNYESLFVRNNEGGPKLELKENILEFLESCRGNNVALIIDESHKVKESTSLQTQALKKIQSTCQLRSVNTYTYLMTGTPFTTGFIDIYNQLKFLGWGGTKTQFCDNFCIRGNIPILMPWQQPIVGYKNTNLLFELVHRYAITIKTNEVIQLPEQVFVNHTLKNTNEMTLYSAEKLKASIINEEIKKRGLNTFVKEGERDGRVPNPFFRNIAYPSLDWIADTAGTMWMRARQLSIGFQGNEESAHWYNKDRLEEIKKLLEENEDNYVIFYNYTPEFIELFEICESLGYKIDVYNGLIKSLRYYDEFSKLSEDEKLSNKKRVIISNYASGGTGLNLQEYNKCILFSIPLFKDYTQSIKRVHRTGSKETVIYHIFTQNNWLDKSMLNALQTQKEYDQNLFETDLKRIQEVLGND